MAGKQENTKENKQLQKKTGDIVPISYSVQEAVLAQGDLSKLSSEERVRYYLKVCEVSKLDPHSRPFDYIELNGKLTLYAKKSATDQLRVRDKVSVKIMKRESLNGVYMVTAKATNQHGVEDESIGVVSIDGLSGNNLANAIMKAETKAKRRVTLSICGMGILDETELESIPRDVTPKKKQSNGPIPVDQMEPYEVGQQTLTTKAYQGKICDADPMVLEQVKQNMQQWCLNNPKDKNFAWAKRSIDLIETWLVNLGSIGEDVEAPPVSEEMSAAETASNELNELDKFMNEGETDA